MGKSRRDSMGRTLRKGESFRKYDKMYIYKYTEPNGKKRYMYAKSLTKLREKEEQLKKDQMDGLDVYTKGKASINFVFDRYIHTKSELRASTYSNYNYMYNRFVRDGFGKRKIGDIKYSDVLEFYIYLTKEREIAINTLDTIHTVLHPVFQMAVRDDIIRKNPSDGVWAEIKKKNFGKAAGIKHALTLEQQKEFLGYLEDDDYHRWKPLFVVMFGTGLRIGELVGLRWEDVDFEKRMINVNHTLTYYPRTKNSNRCEFAISKPKTESGIRSVPILNEVYDALIEEKQIQE